LLQADRVLRGYIKLCFTEASECRTFREVPIYSDAFVLCIAFGVGVGSKAVEWRPRSHDPWAEPAAVLRGRRLLDDTAATTWRFCVRVFHRIRTKASMV